MLFTVAMASVFLVTGCIFIIYVWFVRRRQEKLLHSAMRTNAIVSSLFPATVRQRLLEQAATQAGKESTFDTIPKNKLQNFLSGDSDEKEMHSEPIADFFPETTGTFEGSHSAYLLPFQNPASHSASAFIQLSLLIWWYARRRLNG
jgi:hypothetical protein